MMTTSPFELIYAAQVKAHLKAIDRKFHSLIQQTIGNQLRFEPDIETKNRKPLTRPVEFDADWEMQCARTIASVCFTRLIKLNVRSILQRLGLSVEIASLSVEKKLTYENSACC